MKSNDTASIYRRNAMWSAIAGTLFLAVAIFGKKGWDWSRIACLAAGVFNVALSIQQRGKAKATPSGTTPE
jgi:hypothetical protein